MNKKIQIGIIWANPYNKNMGVAALAYSSLALLKDITDQNDIDAEFSFFGSDKNSKSSLTIDGKSINFKNMYGMNFFHWKSFIKLFLFPRRFNTLKILGLDYVFDIAEGDSFTDIYGEERFWRILNSKRFFSFFNKKQILLPQTIGPFENANHEKKAFDIMRKMDTIISRDKQSYEYTLEFLPKEKINETIDVAFYMPFEQQTHNNGKINVGINISGLLWNGGYTRNNQFNLKTDYQKLIQKTISYFLSIQNVQLHLVPHVIPENAPIENDYAVCLEIIKDNNQIILSPRFKTPIEAKSYISGLDFFIGARMHACIAAFSTGIPVFPMAYSRKFNGLFAETLQYEWMGDCVNEPEDIIVTKLIDAYNKRALLKEQVKLTNQTIVKPRLELLKSIISNQLNK